MKTTATITFHASHNYGSMLQAYALQQTLLSLGVSNEIINLRTPVQRGMYPNPASVSDRGLKHRVKKVLNAVLFPGATRQLMEKYKAFENFIDSNYVLTEEVGEIAADSSLAKRFDYYITGSDQCWNTRCSDFDWAYYLDFTNSPNKIAYAASMGPVSHVNQAEGIKARLGQFKAISAREAGTADTIASLCHARPAILPDPTLLLSQDRWRELAGSKPLIEGPYVFLYTPYKKADVVEIAIKVSKISGMPIVVSNFTSLKKDYFVLKRNGAIFRLDVGPKEFLNLIANARVVVSGSFHALVFSMIMHVPFWAVNGDNDNRMKQLLTKYGFQGRAIHIDDVEDKINDVPSFELSDSVIKAEKDRAISFLRDSLDLY
ncbi:MAG: polysaccharide pyruvyl transferase family protein [Muribaculaceae bacterium]|nr:polysaccharide pyruvyl transferase family protein [Muribaculaceae bacterium]